MADVVSARKLASIVAIDVAGYSRRTEADEEATVGVVAALKIAVAKAAHAHGGRVFNTAGDGFMLEFPTASGALAAAEEIAGAGDPPVRVGVHLGEVSVTDGGDLLGHGVNVAARIQQMAQPGAVLASGDVKRAVRGPLGERLKPQGSVRLDKMSETLPVFALAPPAGGRIRGRRFKLPVAPLAAAIILCALGGGTWLAVGLLGGHSARGQHIAVLPFEALSSDPTARYFGEAVSDQILANLSRRQIPTVSRDDAPSLRGPDKDAQIRKLDVGLMFDGAVQDEGGRLTADVHLDDPRAHATLWSASFAGDASRADELQAQVAARVGAVLNAAGRALRPQGGLADPTALGLYLHACDLFQARGSENNPEVIYELLSTLRKVIAKAPDFAPARSDLAKYEAYYVTGYYASGLPPEQAPQFLREAREQANRALALDPKDADAYVALSMMVPAPGWRERERLLRKALDADPEWPHANGFLANVLGEVGRLSEAAEYTGRAAAANPLSPGLGWTAANATALAEIGNTAPADAVIGQLEKLWPTDIDVWNARFQTALFERRWRDAEAVLDDGAARPPVYQARDLAVAHAFLRAAQTRSPSDVAAARMALRGYTGAPLWIPVWYLASLGLVDDAFAMADGMSKAKPDSNTYGVLFYPNTAAMRRDPRFMPLAARLGLVDYWRSTGKWPDFCAEPGLPYDCKAEAAKAVAGRARSS
jgi:adenylate cyclase